ncbi:MAG: indolepyruvate ferredoxin oxidoreductase subunit alpha [Cuniculiplasma divulgatum]|nr:MAG: indolepyruvate ferredoxin oxidoreductase subunit alpha [Cuniculiplasma divulgatum]
MSSYDSILKAKPGDRLFLLGNEAIARGVIEAGVDVATTYPGTPSSEVGDVLFEIAGKAGLKFEFSVNEKVAVESAFAASISGLRSFVFMKHVGMNVAADAIMSIAYTGTGAPMVIMTADDPSMFSSQNEQDNRIYAQLAHLPLIEPSNPQEAKDFLKIAFMISEREGLPVMFRTTTRTSHMRSSVVMGEIQERHRENIPAPPGKYVALPSNSYRYKEALISRMEKISGENYQDLLVTRIGNPESMHGIIASGEAFNIMMDSMKKLGLDIEVLKLGIINPFPEKMVAEFMQKHPTVIVAEEVDPVIETACRSLAQKKGLSVNITGKLDGVFPMSHELSPNSVDKILREILALGRKEQTGTSQLSMDVPARPPVLCPGCPHRGTYFAVKRAVKMLRISDPVYSSDIGCYSLGDYDPFDEATVMLSMGSSVGVASGLTAATDRRAIAFIGDSTFFHGGIPGLINAVHNKSRLLLVIMDNDITAMTGRQPNPGTPLFLAGPSTREVSIEDVVRSAGVDFLKVVDPYDLKETLTAVMDALRHDGVSVIIAKRECALIRDNRNRKLGVEVRFMVNPDKCTGCMNCVTNFACPAMSVSGNKVVIDPNICDGCSVCTQPYVCPFHAIELEGDAGAA